MRSTPSVRSLSERIAARSATVRLVPGRATSGLNRATFMVLREDIRQALRDGWSMRQVWLTLRDEGKVDFGYQAFRRYVRLLAEVEPSALSPRPAQAVATATPPSVRPTSTADASAAGFRFDPQPDPREVF